MSQPAGHPPGSTQPAGAGTPAAKESTDQAASGESCRRQGWFRRAHGMCVHTVLVCCFAMPSPLVTACAGGRTMHRVTSAGTVVLANCRQS